MNRSRLWIIGSVLVIVALVALGWFAGIGPRLADARQADQERDSVATVNRAHELTLAELKGLDEQLPELKNELAELREALPEDAAISTLLGQLNGLAERNGVQLTSFTAEAPSEFAAAGPEQAPADDATGSTAPAPSPAPTPSGETAVAPVTAGSSEFLTIPVNVTVTGPATGMAGFINDLQFGERLVLVTDLEITTDAAGGTSSIDGFIYVLRDQAKAEAEPTATEPEAEAQQ